MRINYSWMSDSISYFQIDTLHFSVTELRTEDDPPLSFPASQPGLVLYIVLTAATVLGLCFPCCVFTNKIIIKLQRMSEAKHCSDIFLFQKTLKKLRDIDDKIIYALNESTPTKSFQV